MVICSMSIYGSIHHIISYHGYGFPFHCFWFWKFYCHFAYWMVLVFVCVCVFSFDQEQKSWFWLIDTNRLTRLFLNYQTYLHETCDYYWHFWKWNFYFLSFLSLKLSLVNSVWFDFVLFLSFYILTIVLNICLLTTSFFLFCFA